MEIIKRTISLEEVIDRKHNSSTWGQVLTANTFHIKLFLTQNMDDMGIFTDVDFTTVGRSRESVDYTPLITKLMSLGYDDFPFMNGVVLEPVTGLTITEQKTLRLPNKVLSDYYNIGGLTISGLTESKIDDVKSYSNTTPYQSGLVINKETYINYQNIQIVGVDKIKTMGEPKIYVFDTKDDSNLGSSNQIYGLRYLDYTGVTREVVINGAKSTIPTTIVNYIGQGWNQTNTSIAAITKEEYLFGIVSRPEVENDVFIDRGQTNVMDLHLRLSEITNMEELTRYGNGYYKINKQ